MTDTRTMMEFESRKKSAGIGYALWFFTGIFGGHRYYMGRWKTGVFLTLCGLSWFFVWSAVLALFGAAVMQDQAVAEGAAGVASLFVVPVLIGGIWALADVFFISGWVRKYNLALMAKLNPETPPT